MSLRNRYASKLLANAFGLVVSAVTQVVVPKALGPAAYGDFGFLTNFFTQFTSFAEMGTANAFFTKVSQRPDDRGLVRFYVGIIFLVLLLILLGIAICELLGLTPRIWPGQSFHNVLLAGIWGVLSWISLLTGRYADAHGLTVASEVCRLANRIFGLALLLVLFLADTLTLEAFFYYNFVTLALLSVSSAWVVQKRGIPLFSREPLGGARLRELILEFYEYSHPLIVYGILMFPLSFLDRWILQVFGGSVQQGYYTLAYQIGAVCFMVTGAMTPLILREFSVSHGKGDRAQMVRLFERAIPLFYCLVAYFSCFTAVSADKVIHLFFAGDYDDAILPVEIMALYPIHQTYGQLSGALFYATGQTRAYRNIGVGGFLLGLPIAYALLAPADRFGLGLGAVGLSIKMVFIQFLIVNAQLFSNSRFLGIRFGKYLSHQLLSFAVFLGAAFASVRSVDRLVPDTRLLLRFLIEGMLYSFLILVGILLKPSLFGLGQEDVDRARSFLASRLGKRGG